MDAVGRHLLGRATWLTSAAPPTGRSAPPGTLACPVAARDRNPGPREKRQCWPLLQQPAIAELRADMTHAGKDAPWARQATSTSSIIGREDVDKCFRPCLPGFG